MSTFRWKLRSIGWGIILLALGILWVLKDLGYIPGVVSMWALFFIVVGCWWIVSRILVH